MNIVIDTSALLAVCTNEASKPALVQSTAGATLLAPTSVHWEVGNALSAMLRRARITPYQAALCIDAYRQIPIRFADVDLGRSVEIAGQHGLYAYDAYLLACAEQANAPLLTLDKALQNAARGFGVELVGEQL